MVNKNLIERDLKHIWHPCSQMKDFEKNPPFIVEKAKGSYFYTNKGPLIDANSSWWCKSLGHNQPNITKAITNQLSNYEHVITANTVNPILVELAEKLSKITQLQHAFFASDGSCAVEIALKLAIHSQVIKGKNHKNEFIALGNGYHGETLATLAVSDLGIYKAPYEGYGVPCHFIKDIPYVTGINDPLWSDCQSYWTGAEKYLNSLSENVCAIIIEPILQGAGGMKVYSADFLRRLSGWAKNKDILIIADEIMTGCGRTGKWLASEYAGFTPDMVCLSKGLTSGTVPFSCTMIDDDIYQLFYDNYDKGKSFLHSHTYSGNALGAAAALATIKEIKNQNIIEHSKQLSTSLHNAFQTVMTECSKLENFRSIGGMVAADLITSNQKRLGYQVYLQALELGAFLRPLGNTVYWLPPLNIEQNTIEKLMQITIEAINNAYDN